MCIRDRRERGPTSRVLDVRRDREIFERLTALDYDFLLCQRFAAGPRVLGDLLPQSVVGRAQNGHGWFTDEFGVSLRFPDATFERVLSVLERIDPNLRGTQVRERRGALVTRFGLWLLANADRPRRRTPRQAGARSPGGCRRRALPSRSASG